MQPAGDTTTQSGTQASVLKSAALMSLGTLISRILGLVRDTLMAALFSRLITDAYVVAFRLPNLFRRLLGEGSLSASFVPLFIESMTPKPGETKAQVETRAQEFSNAIFTLLSAVTAVLSVIGIVYMEPIMAHLVSGENFQSVPGKFETTVEMAQIMFGFLFLVMSYAYLMSILNAYKKFFLAALAPAGFNLLLVISALLPEFKFSGDQLAWGVLAGGFLQLFMVAVPLWKMGHLPKITTKIWSKYTRQFFQKLLPSLLGTGVLQILTIINVNFASKLPQGSHSYIYLADRLLEFPLSLISVSLGVALLPTLSEMWARGQKEKMVSTVHDHVRMLMVLALPSAVGLYLLSTSIVKAIYMRGQFDIKDAMLTAQVVQTYTLLLVFTSIHRVMVPSFYAIKNTWLPALNSAFCVLIHFFVASWATEHYGLQGLVGATVFTASVNLALLLISFKIYFLDLGTLKFFKSLLWLMPSVLVLAGIVYFGQDFAIQYLGQIFGLIVIITFSAVGFFAIGGWTKHPEISHISSKLLKRIK